jgi:hypothetical protein
VSSSIYPAAAIPQPLRSQLVRLERRRLRALSSSVCLPILRTRSRDEAARACPRLLLGPARLGGPARRASDSTAGLGGRHLPRSPHMSLRRRWWCTTRVRRTLLAGYRSHAGIVANKRADRDCRANNDVVTGSTGHFVLDCFTEDAFLVTQGHPFRDTSVCLSGLLDRSLQSGSSFFFSVGAMFCLQQ